MAKRPLATVLTVIPSPATSAASVLNSPTVASRCALERARFGIGSRTELDATFTSLPQPRSLMPGSAASTRVRGESTSVR